MASYFGHFHDRHFEQLENETVFEAKNIMKTINDAFYDFQIPPFAIAESAILSE